MSVAAHTQGPWLMGADPEGDAPGKISVHTDDGFYICLVDNAKNEEANARLIAAAPCMLAVLEGLDNLTAADAAKVVAVIRKAKGGAS